MPHRASSRPAWRRRRFPFLSPCTASCPPAPPARPPSPQAAASPSPEPSAAARHLRGVLAGAVAGVDDGDVGRRRRLLGAACLEVAQHHHVGVALHGANGVCATQAGSGGEQRDGRRGCKVEGWGERSRGCEVFAHARLQPQCVCATQEGWGETEGQQEGMGPLRCGFLPEERKEGGQESRRKWKKTRARQHALPAAKVRLPGACRGAQPRGASSDNHQAACLLLHALLQRRACTHPQPHANRRPAACACGTRRHLLHPYTPAPASTRTL